MAKMLGRFPYEPSCLRFVRYIRNMRAERTTRFFTKIGQFVLVSADRHDPKTVLCEKQGRRPPDAAARARNQCDFLVHNLRLGIRGRFGR